MGDMGETGTAGRRRAWRRIATAGLLSPWLGLAGCPEEDANATDTGTDTVTDTDPSAGTDPTTGATTSDATTDPSMSGSATTTMTSAGTTTDTDPSTTDDPSTTTDTDTTDSDTTDTGNVDPSSFGLTIDDVASPPRLVKIDLGTGQGTAVCDLPPGRVYDTVTFGRDNTLYAHNVGSDRIESIDPCDCGFVVIGATSLGTLEMTVDGDDGLFGIDPEFNAFVTINPNTGLATVVGALGVVLDAGGIAWSDAAGEAWVVDATTDQLLVVDLDTGVGAIGAVLSDPVTTPGVEHDNVTNTLYVCDGDNLYTLDPDSGDFTDVGAIGLDGPCDNLAIPFAAIGCLEG